MMTPPHNYLAVIKVVGIGGGGVNAVNRMIEQGLKGVEFIAINPDAQALLMSDADVKLDGGRHPPRCVAAAAGGGPAAGGAPVVATSSRKLGGLTAAVGTRPFWFEGRPRSNQAE